MSFLSISSEIASLLASENKRYSTAYKDVGFELGFGRGGAYKGHSHLRFIDLMFSPDRILWCGDESREANTMVIAPPRTYLPDVETGDFVFLKFCPDGGEVILPDKVNEALYEQQILTFTDEARLTFPWYTHPRAERQNVEVTLHGTELTIEMGRSGSLVVRR